MYPTAKAGILLASVAGMGLIAPASYAQNADVAATQAAPGASDIIVTARRRAESLQAVPVAVTAVSTEELAQRSVRAIDDIARIAPNLQIGQSTRGAGVADITLRGQQNTGTAITNDPAVGIYFDEVYLGRSAGNLASSLQDMASVQVLRGPQGTLFGRNNTGGAILLTPNRPELADFSGSVNVKYGNRDFFELGGFVDIPIVEGSLGVRGSFTRTRRDGTGRSVTTGIDSFGNRHRESGRAAVRWMPSDTVTFDFTYDFANINETGQLSVRSLQPAGLGFYEGELGIADPLSRVRTKGYTFRSEVQVNPDMTLKAIVGRRFVKTNMRSDIDQTPATSIDVRQYADVDQWTAEVQLSGTAFRDAAPWLSGVNYTAGAFYFVEDGEDSSILPLPVGSFLGIGRTLQNIARNQSTAAYLQIETNHGDKLFLTAGGRYTKDKRSLSIRTVVNSVCALGAYQPNPPPIDLCFQSASATFGYWSYSVGARYQFTPDVNAYLKFDRGQRAGGLDDTPLSIEPFFPEVVKSLEAGIKFTAWDRRLRANLALFHMNIDNVQRSVLLIEPTTNSPYASVFNAAKSRVRGLELDVSLEPVKGLTFGGTLGLMDPKYKRFVDPASGADRSDLDFPSSPKRTYSLSAAYQTEVSDGVDVLFRADWSHRSRMVWDVFNSPLTVQKPYGLLNGRVQLDVTPEVLGARFGIALFGRNLTDRKYNTYATTAGGGFYVRNEDRRTIGVEVTAGF